MPITIEAVEQARDDLVAAIDDSNTQNVIFDAGVIAGSIIDVLRNNVQNIRTSIAQNEIPFQDINFILQRLQDFHVLLTKYFVRVAAKYKVLLEKVGGFVLSGTEDFSLRSIKNLSQISSIEKDWKEYEQFDTQVCDSAEEFFNDARKTAVNIALSKSDQTRVTQNCLLFATKVQMFVDTKKDLFKRFNELLQQQRTVHIPRMLQMSQSLIEKKQFIFVD